MTFVELVQAVAADTGVSLTKVATVLSSAFRIILDRVVSGESVRLRGFGYFYPTIIHPKTLFGGLRESKRRVIVRFKENRNGQVRRRDRAGQDEDR